MIGNDDVGSFDRHFRTHCISFLKPDQKRCYQNILHELDIAYDTTSTAFRSRIHFTGRFLCESTTSQQWPDTFHS